MSLLDCLLARLGTDNEKLGMLADVLGKINPVRYNEMLKSIVWEMRRGVSRQNCEWLGGNPLLLFCVGPNAPFWVRIGA